METAQDAILDLACDHGRIRPSDLDAHGLPRVSPTRLVRTLPALEARSARRVVPDRRRRGRIAAVA